MCLGILLYIIIGAILGISCHLFEKYYKQLTGKFTAGFIGDISDDNLFLIFPIFWPIICIGYIIYYMIHPIKLFLDKIGPKILFKCFSKERKTEIILGANKSRRND